MGVLTPSGYDVLAEFKPTSQVTRRMAWPSADEGSFAHVDSNRSAEFAVWRPGHSRRARYTVVVDIAEGNVPDDYASNFPDSISKILIFTCRELEWSFKSDLDGAWQENTTAEVRSATLSAFISLIGFLGNARSGRERVAGTARTERQSDSDTEQVDARRERPASEPRLQRVERVDAASLQLLTVSSEALVGQVRQCLQNGLWSRSNGYEIGFEDDVSRDLEELERQLRPLSGRSPNITIVQEYITQLSQYLLDLAERQAEGEMRQRVDLIRREVIDRLSSFNGTSEDVHRAEQAMSELAFAAAWHQSSKPDAVSDEAWSAFLAQADSDPRSIFRQALGWTPLTLQEKATGVFGSMTTASAVGFLAQSVSTWAGATAGPASAAGFVAGVVGAIAGAVLGVLSVRFVSYDGQ